MNGEFAYRMRKVRRALGRRKLGAILIADPANVRYMAGVSDATWAVVCPTAAYIMPSRLSDFSVRSFACKPWRVANWRDAGTALRRILQKARVRRLGIEAASLSMARRESLAREIEGVALTVGVTGVVESIRAVKSAGEIREMRKAGWIAAEVARQLPYMLRPGRKEQELAAEIDRRMRDLGADGIAFPTIALAGDRTVYPHGEPQDRAFKPGELCLADFGAMVKGYRSDITRVLCVGKASSLQKRRYRQVYEAYRRGESALGAGKRCGNVHESVSRALGPAAGHFTHGLGHGVGLEIHEGPRLAAHERCVLARGNVVTVEPGLYYPGWGGIRLENTLLVEAGGAVSLTGQIPPEPPVSRIC